MFSSFDVVPFSMRDENCLVVVTVKTGGFLDVSGLETEGVRGAGDDCFDSKDTTRCGVIGLTLNSINSPPMRVHRCLTLPVTSVG